LAIIQLPVDILALPVPSFSAFAAPRSPSSGGRDEAGSVLRLQPATPTPDGTPDDTLLAALAAGDERAAAELYDRFAPTIMAVAFRVTRSRADAEDVVLETLEQVWRSAQRYERTRGSLQAWLTVIARSRAFDRMRTAQRRARHVVAMEDQPGGAILEAPSDGPTPVESVEASERRRLVAQAMAGLPAAQREAVELAFYDGLSHGEVAAKLSEPLGTVKTRIRLGMLKLRDQLRPLSPEARP
jgi:RNA polymerase sigma-70 factor, ECF subfamily